MKKSVGQSMCLVTRNLFHGRKMRRHTYNAVVFTRCRDLVPGWLGLLAAVLLCACTQPDRSGIRFGLASEPVTLDPRFATDAASVRINRLLYQRLVEFDAALLPVPGLATWQVLTPTRYRFTLSEPRPRFHDGTPLTAADVVATYRFILDPANASPHRGSLAMLESLSAVNDHQIDFNLSRAAPGFPGYLVIGILPASQIAAGHPFGREPLGSGPFGFLGWLDDGRLQLKRVDDGKAFEFIYVKDPTVRLLKLLRGEIDMFQNDLAPELVGYAAQQEDVYVLHGPGSNFTYLGFNMDDAATGQAAVREAIAQAIDRQRIIRYVLGGHAHPAQALLPPDHWAGYRGEQAWQYDPPAARRLLAQAGYGPENPLHLVYKTSSDPFRIRLATIIQKQLRDVNIHVDVRSYDWGTFYGDVKAGRFQMFSLSWVGIKTPDIFRYVFHSASVPPDGANRGRFRHPRVDALIERADQALDTGERAQAYAELQGELLMTLPYVPLWYEDHVFVARDDIAGYQVARDGNYDSLAHVTRTARP